MGEKTKFNLIEKIKSNKKIQYFLIVILSLLMVFFVLGKGIFKNNQSKTIESMSYVESLESRLEETLSKVKGVGRVSVVINVESGQETVLAMKTTTTENSTGKHIETTPILVGGKTVVIKELNPKITGVLIVFEGAESIAVMNKIQQATQSLLDINVNKIEILSMK